MLQFTKMQAAGNDFVVVDATINPFRLRAHDIRYLADRHYGIGFDQLLIVRKSSSAKADFGYRIFNADGSEAKMCGNGARCFALFVRNHKLTTKKSIKVKTKTSFITLDVLDGNLVRVKMGKARFSPSIIPFLDGRFKRKWIGKARLYKLATKEKDNWFGVVNVGNPHAIFITDNARDIALHGLAYALRHSSAFPDDVNVSVLEVRSESEAFLRVNERGVGETLACGSGACAAFVLAHRMGLLKEKATIRMTGGQVTVEIDQNRDIFLTGTAQEVFTGFVMENQDENQDENDND